MSDPLVSQLRGELARIRLRDDDFEHPLVVVAWAVFGLLAIVIVPLWIACLQHHYPFLCMLQALWNGQVHFIWEPVP